MISMIKIPHRWDDGTYDLGLAGRSSDTKPTKIYNDMEIANCSSFFNMDEAKVYFYDKGTDTWVAPKTTTSSSTSDSGSSSDTGSGTSDTGSGTSGTDSGTSTSGSDTGTSTGDSGSGTSSTATIGTTVSTMAVSVYNTNDDNTVAEGGNLAVGAGNTVSGYSSFAVGNANTAKGTDSITIGNHLTANNFQTVIGQQNKELTSVYPLIVGGAGENTLIVPLADAGTVTSGIIIYGSDGKYWHITVNAGSMVIEDVTSKLS